MGTIVTISLFLVAQTIGAVWWASGVASELEGVKDNLNQIKVNVEAEKNARTDERRRIYDRITSQDRIISEIVA